jgi:hypothetical protein
MSNATQSGQWQMLRTDIPPPRAHKDTRMINRPATCERRPTEERMRTSVGRATKAWKSEERDNGLAFLLLDDEDDEDDRR